MSVRASFRSAILVLAIVLSACVSSRRSGFNPGDAAPQLKVKDLDGNIKTLEDFKGKVVLLNFWATWCMTCAMEIPSLQNLYSLLKDEGFVVVGVGVDDTPWAMQSYKEKQNITFPLFHDPENQSKKNYRITGVPESFVIDRDGHLLMVVDPDDDEPVVRLVGPKKWDSPSFVSRLREILTSRR